MTENSFTDAVQMARCYLRAASVVDHTARTGRDDLRQIAAEYRQDGKVDQAIALEHQIQAMETDPVGYWFGRTSDGQAYRPDGFPGDREWQPANDSRQNLLQAKELLEKALTLIGAPAEEEK